MHRRWKIVVLMCCVALAPHQVSAQLRGPELAAAIDRYVEPLLSLHTFSGVVLLARNDSILSERSYGLADVELNVPMTRNSAFRIASVSKSFTRALVGRLAEKGVLSLDAKLSTWLPEFPSASRITLQMLLDHRAGVAHRNSLPYDEEASVPHTLRMLIDTLTHTPLDFPPDSTRRYSNGGYAVLAYVIERSTGRSFEEVLCTELLKPLGLTHTQHQRDGELISGLAHGVTPSPFDVDVLVAAPYQEMITKIGGGSLVSTAHDLLTWSRAIGTHPVLSRATWQRLFQNDTLFTLDGRSPGYMTTVSREGEITAIVLANNYNAMVGDIASAVMAFAKGRTPAMLPVRGPRPSSVADDAVVGQYRIPPGSSLSPNSKFEVRRMHGNLVAWLDDIATDVLVPQAPNVYLLRNLWLMATYTEANLSGTAHLDFKAIHRDASFRAQRIHTSSARELPAADVAVAVLETALRFYSPPVRQLRWLEKPTALDERLYHDLLGRLGSKFQPWEAGDTQHENGGILRVGDVLTLAGDRWRVTVRYRHHQRGIIGPESTQTFTVERRDGKFTVVSRE